ncbi:uncharacterized protein LOC122500760 [Leptopilina heterotoma]|uniref:uncharacterized protein LOC122500760 n=1 Tax=Leptopilina heterotoma TaxID=63436 RepID=UPI001CA7C953|nr:uncharacterized protein LOC122500760 [Leptopilina heterotoma]
MKMSLDKITMLNIFLLLLYSLRGTTSTSYHTVNIQQGTLKGASVETDFGEFISFSGIPYAEPPIGELRFKDPQPAKAWNGVRDATIEGRMSAQFSMYDLKLVGGEDCLYLNVATKSLSGKKPVMVWIHGGAFMTGSGSYDLYRPDYFLQHDVVFVTLNSRLGILGFLNMGVESCSGNQGLKDQIFALRWIQENIEAFGGDKDSVTIFGQSSGSGSVHLLSISPLAKGLFHKAIMQSGVGTNPWCSPKSNDEYARKIAIDLGFTSLNNAEIAEFLRTVPIEKLFETERKLFPTFLTKMRYNFIPTIDDKSVNPVLPRPLHEMIKNGINVPVIIGYTSHEGIPKLGYPGINDHIKNLNENFQNILSEDFHLNYTLDSNLCKDVRNFYFKENTLIDLKDENFIQFESDWNFVSGIYDVLEVQSQKATPTYLYKYSYNTEISIIKMFINSNVKGAAHSDDLTILFYMKAFPPNMQLKSGTIDYLIMQRMTKMWTDFARTGNPTPETNELITSNWSPYNSNQKVCLHISEELKAEGNFEEKSWNVWKPIYHKVFFCKMRMSLDKFTILNIFLLLLYSLRGTTSTSYHTVNIQQGTLKGASVETDFGEFISFSGIPYAEPPIGELRFKDPQPAKAWNGVRDATIEGGMSAQFSVFESKLVGGEDCLYLNIATKNLTGKKPVMVWIHGGAFLIGSGSFDEFRPDYFLQHDVVFVSLNYRLGILGFLNMGVESCSGNQGLKDQIFALRWIQENIEAFGGDKDSVTIFGQSAGSVSVHLLSISPLAKGLFHKAIMQSGAGTNPWCSSKSNEEYARKISSDLGFTSSNNAEIAEFLRTVPIEKLFETERRLFPTFVTKMRYNFIPTIDDKSVNPVLPRPLHEMIKNGINVPVIIGYTSHEGIPKLGYPGVNDHIKNLNENFQNILSENFHLNYTLDSNLCKDVRNFYFKENTLIDLKDESFIQFESDWNFVAGIYDVLEVQSQKATPTFLYKYSYNTEISIIKMFFNLNIKGASHSDDLTILFYMKVFQPNMQLKSGTIDYLIMQRMTKMWTDFARTGNPTPETNDLITSNWSPYNSNQKVCLHITEELKAEGNYEEKSWNVWKPIYHKVFP